MTPSLSEEKKLFILSVHYTVIEKRTFSVFIFSFILCLHLPFLCIMHILQMCKCFLLCFLIQISRSTVWNKEAVNIFSLFLALPFVSLSFCCLITLLQVFSGGDTLLNEDMFPLKMLCILGMFYIVGRMKFGRENWIIARCNFDLHETNTDCLGTEPWSARYKILVLVIQL